MAGNLIPPNARLWEAYCPVCDIRQWGWEGSAKTCQICELIIPDDQINWNIGFESLRDRRRERQEKTEMPEEKKDPKVILASFGDLTDISETSLKLVRADFNPSEREDVSNLKILGAALLDAVDRYGNDGRASAIAKTHIETAVMYAVKSATA